MHGFNKRMRRNESYQNVAAYLSEQGYSYEPMRGPNHPYILINAGVGKPIKFFFPMTASDHRSAKNAVREVKRLIQTRLGGPQ